MELFATEFLHSQLFWTAVSFTILLLMMAKFVVPALTKVLDARALQISDDLASAEEHRVQAEKLLADYEAKLNKAKQEAAGIVTDARNEAQDLINGRTAELEAELKRKADKAAQSIETAKQNALKEVQAEVAQLTVQLAEKLIGDTVDAKKAQTLTDKALKNLVN